MQCSFKYEERDSCLLRKELFEWHSTAVMFSSAGLVSRILSVSLCWPTEKTKWLWLRTRGNPSRFARSVILQPPFPSGISPAPQRLFDSPLASWWSGVKVQSGCGMRQDSSKSAISIPLPPWSTLLRSGHWVSTEMGSGGVAAGLLFSGTEAH